SEVISGEYENAKDVAAFLDKTILENYKPFATGPVAASMLDNLDIDLTDKYHQVAKQYLEDRLENLNHAEKSKLLSMYAAAYKQQLSHDL
ncbi:MAG: cytochrome C oxidase Cbb3, partial [Paraglaciecola sp.]